MTEPEKITDEDLHAYLDGALDPARGAMVETYLADHPDEADRLAGYAEITAELQAGFPLEKSVPARLLDVLEPTARRPFFSGIANIAAGVALLLGGIGIGWSLNTPVPATSPRLVANEAIAAHAIFSVEVLHPVEVASEQQDHLVKWLSNRLGADIKAPDLASKGFTLLGGRLLSSDTGPAAQFMFENAAGRRVTLYATDSKANTGTAFKFTSLDGFEAFYWMDSDITYALVGDISKEELRTLALAVYSQLI